MRKVTRCRRSGLSLVEVMVCTVIVGVMLVSATRMLRSVVAGRVESVDDHRASLLAATLLYEVMNQAYIEPDDTPGFGPESGETTTGRTAFDDVDDYHDWSSAPPQYRDGNTMAELDGWLRTVNVEFVDPSDPTAVVGSDLGCKRITVSVFHDGELKLTTMAIVSDGET